MSRIENATADARVLRDEELDAANGADSKTSRVTRFNVELYSEKMTFNLQEYDA